MKRKLPSIVIGVLFLASVSFGEANLLDFEDLGGGYRSTGKIPDGYRGLSWSKSSYWVTKRLLPGTGYEHGTLGGVSLFTAFGDDISLSGDMFSFSGAYITSAINDTEEVTVEGWRHGSRVYIKTITTHNDQAYWFDFKFKDIDSLRFLPLGRHVVIDNITFGESVTPVEIDIKPGSPDNPVNLKSKGKLPVAILASDDFDALEVNPETVGLGPGGASPVHSVLEDVDGDGDLDMVLHFKTQDVGISVGDTAAILTGELFDGTSIEGKDSIRIVPRAK